MASTAATAERLKEVPLFSGLGKRDLRRLAGKVRERRYKPGTAVVQEGKMSGIGFFVITDGEATVQVGGKEVSRLGPGDHFGELALIVKRERTATVTAETPLECLELTAWDFRDFVRGDPDVSWKLLLHVTELLLGERGDRS
jgi:CRP-like cAMP-binding protein